ncbi:uncharacterized protein AB9W97_005718 isoform 3-T3 [Spinachia spinachia]
MEPTMKRKISPMWEHFELTDSTSNKEFGYNNNTSMLRHYRNLHENKEPPENKSWMKHLFSMIVKNTQPFSIVDDVLMFFLQVSPEASSLVMRCAIIRRTLNSKCLLRTAQDLHGVEEQLKGLRQLQSHRVRLSTPAGMAEFPKLLPQVHHLL